MKVLRRDEMIILYCTERRKGGGVCNLTHSKNKHYQRQPKKRRVSCWRGGVVFEEIKVCRPVGRERKRREG